MSRSIEGAFTKSDDQIAGTKGALTIPDAVGVLCVLNERVDILSPEVIVHKIAALLKKPGPDRAPRYSRVEQVVILSETHRLPTDIGPILLPIMRLERPGAGGHAVVDSIFEQWSRASGVPVLKAAGELTPDMIAKFVSARPAPTKPSRLPRHEYWRQQYRERPYLAKLSLEQFQDLAVRTFAETARSMLKGATPLTREESLVVWERVTHVFEEVNRRGLDMREALPPEHVRNAMER
jgi:hypothetical protein